MTGVSYATSAEMAAELGAFPGYEPNADDMLRVMRNHRRAAHGEAEFYEKLATAPGAARPRLAQRRSPRRSGEARLGPRSRTRPGARLSQRAGDRRRADRHHRPRDGLRHDRHRARLRPRQIQEARGRRLLQDHQPVGAGSACARSATAKAQIAEIEAYAVGHASLAQAPAINTAALKARGFTDAALAKIEKGLGAAFDIKFVFNRWTLGDEFLTETLGVPAEKLNDPAFDRSRPSRASRRSRHRGRQRARLRSHDARRRAASEARAPARLRLRQPVRHAKASAISRSRATSA